MLLVDTGSHAASVGHLAEQRCCYCGPRENLTPDAGASYDQLIKLNMSELEPHINGGCKRLRLQALGLSSKVRQYTDAVSTFDPH